MSSSSTSSSGDRSSSPFGSSPQAAGSAQPRPTQLPPPPLSSSQDEPGDSSQPSSGMAFLRNRKARNAHSKSITTAEGVDTHGALNRHPAVYSDFSVGVQDAQGARMTMEDAYSFVVDFAGVRGQGFFAIFDGHAGPEAAEWCGNHFHERFLSDLKENPEMSITDVMNKTFLAVDHDLSNLSEDKGLSSGCTAVTAFLRLEDQQGNQTFLQNQSSFGELSAASSTDETSTDVRMADPLQDLSLQREKKSNSGRGGFRNAVRSLATSVTRSRPSSPAPSSTPRSSSPNTQHPPLFETSTLGLRRVLYTANAGDARAVLSRAGKAVRLTYDHKGADKQEAKRIQDAGGFVLNNRVNGVLAVTRSLGDSSMKEFVVGSPYTTETPLTANDEFLILACDGLWDVASDQKAVELVRDVHDCDEAAKILMEFALNEGTRDNVTVVVVRFHKPAK